MQTSKNQDKELLIDILQKDYFNHFQQGYKSIEIFLFGLCSANCDYCYLKKFQKELYPTNIHNYDTIIKNLQLILNWYIENNFNCKIQLFSAEWLTLPIANQIFSCFYEAFKNSQNKPPAIIAPDNMQFLKNDDLTKEIENWLDKFRNIGIDFAISASIDGKYCDESRTLNDDDFYLKLKNFLNKYNFHVHPMISSFNIENWQQNYLWWKEFFGDDTYLNRMFCLEVRQNEWDEKSLQHLVNYYDFIIDDIFINHFNKDRLKMLKYIFNIKDQDTVYRDPKKMCIGFSNFENLMNVDKSTCSIKDTLFIRAGDLKIIPCHRQAYPELEIAEFIVQDNKIVDINEINVSLLLLYNTLKRSCLPKCESCKYIGVCLGHCYGASYENYKNPLVPQSNVCKLFQTKYDFLIYKYYTLGLYELLPEILPKIPLEVYNYFVDLSKNVLGGFIDYE